jgi:hypothetical protein
MDYYKKYLKYKSKYTLAKENMRGGAIDILDYYKQTVGLVMYRLGGFVQVIKQSYCDKVISEHHASIQRFDLAFKYLGQEGRDLGYFISIVKGWTHHMELIFALALDSSDATTQVKPYLLANGITIYPMCLRFVCRLVLNELCKEKEDLYCLLKEVNYKARSYWDEETGSSILPDGNPSFIPTCLLVGHMRFPLNAPNEEILDTLYAWFGIMHPSELGGFDEIKKKIMDLINIQVEHIKLRILKQIVQLMKGETSIVRENYFISPGDTSVNLTIGFIAELLLPTGTKLNDDQIAAIIQIPVHSGTKINEKWQMELLKVLETGTASVKDINRIIKSDRYYLGGRWLVTQLKSFIVEYPQYKDIVSI